MGFGAGMHNRNNGVCAVYGRLERALEIAVFSLVATGLAFVAAVVIKLISKKSIGTSKYYSTAGMIGALVYVGLMSVLPKSEGNESSGEVPSKSIFAPVLGLDAQFIVRPSDKPESFVQQLHDATAPLSVADQAELDEAFSFLTWVEGDHIRQTEPAKFAKWTPNDVAAHSLFILHQFAIDNGDKMTLRQYIVLANEWKRQKPDLLKRYTAETK